VCDRTDSAITQSSQSGSVRTSSAGFDPRSVIPLESPAKMSRTLRFVIPLMLAFSTAAWGQLVDPTISTNRITVPPTPANNWTDVFVSCPAGLVALSGGIDTNDYTVIEATTLAPTFAGTALAFVPDGSRGPADGWYASLINHGSVGHPVAVFVVCTAVSNVVVNVASAAVTSGSINVPGNGTAFTSCPNGYPAVGGGVDVNAPSSMKVSASAPIYNSQFLIDRPAGLLGAPTGWTGSVRSEGNSGVIKVAAVCAQISGVNSVSSGPFSIGPGTVSGLSAQCPAGAIALGGGIDSNDVSRNAVAVSTVLFGSNPQFPVDRATGSHSSASRWYGIYYNYGPGTTSGAVAVICAQPSPNIVLVYEFYNTNLRHYFRTSSAAEANAIDRGSAGAGWVRTGDNFFAYVAGSSSPGSDVCRFYTFGANSHFYTAFAQECAGLKSPSSGWSYEELSFRIQLPVGSTCPAGTKPVHRLYNNRFQFNDSNHRFTTIAAEVPVLQAQGWIYEGIAFCALDL
jgi:hypothetical protein